MWRRALPALVLLGGFAALAGLYIWGGDGYFALRRAAGLKPFEPFLDLHNVMAAIACWRDGVDVYATNPCDALGRVHIYSPLWLRLPEVFGRAEWTRWFGVVLAIGVIAATTLLPAARDRWANAVMLLAVVSPATGFVLERANMDGLIFVAVVLGAVLLAGGLAARAVGYALFLAMGLLKFYPMVLLALLVRERPRVALALGVAAVAVMAGAVLPLADEFRRAVANIPPNDVFTDTFGAWQLAKGVTLLVPGHGLAALVLGGAVVAMALAGVVRVAGDDGLGRALAALPRRHADLLQVGAAAIVGCFLAGQNVEYRAIFLLPTLPALLLLAGGAVRAPLLGATAWGIVWLMWDPVLRRLVARLAPPVEDVPALPGLVVWTVREALWWAVASVLAGLVAAMLRRAPGWGLLPGRL